MSPRVDLGAVPSSLYLSKVAAILGMDSLATEVRSGELRTSNSAMSEPARTEPPPTGASRQPDLRPTTAIPTPAPRLGWWAWLKHLVVHNVLHLDDTPHRIAWGVFWGFLIGATPTIGIQVILYLIVATFVGANRVSGILPIWLSNPLTAIPLYYSEWFLGRFLLTGSLTVTESGWDAIAEAIKPRPGSSWWQRFFDPDMWIVLFESLVDMGGELWLGSIVAGILSGAIGYWFTYRAVVEFRRRRHHEGA